MLFISVLGRFFCLKIGFNSAGFHFWGAIKKQYLMTHKSKQAQAEETKTISITEITQLQFKVLKPDKGIIELVNTADQGRVCSLKISDFRSTQDAKIYAELLRLAPELLNEYICNTKTMEQVVGRLKKKVTIMNGKTKASNRNPTK